VIAVLALAAIAFDLPSRGTRLPTVRRQVNEDWLTTYRGWVYGFGFGLQLGFGVVTIVSTAGLYLAFSVALLSGSLTAGLMVGCAFGLGRALPLLATRRITSTDTLKAFHQRMDGWRGGAHKMTIGAEAALVVTAVGLALVRAW
jgi:hypothetical protein